MRHFLYLDNDIVNSIIAQQGKGLVDAITTETEKEETKHKTKELKVDVEGDISAKLLKLANVEAQLSIGGSYESGNTKQDTSREIIAKTLHDAAFDIAYDAVKPTVCCAGNDVADPGSYIEMKRVFDFVDFKYLEELFSKNGAVVKI